MKKFLKAAVSLVAVLGVALSCSSCTLFEAMRENAEKASKIRIEDSPEDADVTSVLGEYIKESEKNAVSVVLNTSYSAGNPEITKDGESAGLLAKTGKTIKKLIMDGKPGKSSEEITGGTENTLLGKIEDVSALGVRCRRNISTETLTDEKGHEVADENGNAETFTFISDNTAHLDIEFFEILNADGTEYVPVPGKNAEEDSTKTVYAASSELEEVFGSPEDKAAVLENFSCVSDFIKIKDYTLEYRKCYINSDVLLNSHQVDFVKFTKEMVVTAVAEGVGELSGYGELQIVFPLTKTLEYNFVYSDDVAQ